MSIVFTWANWILDYEIEGVEVIAHQVINGFYNTCMISKQNDKEGGKVL